MHVHVADVEALLVARRTDPGSPRSGGLARMLRWAGADRLGPRGDGSITDQWVRRLANWVQESPLDKVVLLALDGVFDLAGRACPEVTVVDVDNDFVHSVAAGHPEFLFGASIHPYRRDAVKELERLAGKGACLIKWIPSGQGIKPDDPACFPFYEVLAHYGIPLLSHTGVEHTLGSRRSSWNHPNRLVPALERGVTVIAAHCGLPLFLHEPSFFRSWAALAREHENLYGDSGTFPVVTRVPGLRRVLRDEDLLSKLVYGSDFPAVPSPWWCWQLGPGRIRELARIRNPLARNVHVMQALGMPTEVLERAHDRLGIGKEMVSDEN